MSTRSYRHDERKRLTYQTFSNMKQRCYNPRHATYSDYGEKGVRVFFGWMGRGGFPAFVEDVGLRPSRGHQLDRIDSAKHYEPGNVRWVPRYDNLSAPGRARNCCRNEVEAVGPDGVKRKISLYEWAELLGITYRSLCRRIQRKMGERAFAVKAKA